MNPQQALPEQNNLQTPLEQAPIGIQPPPTATKKSKRYLLVIVFIFIVVLVLGGNLLWYELLGPGKTARVLNDQKAASYVVRDFVDAELSSTSAQTTCEKYVLPSDASMCSKLPTGSLSGAPDVYKAFTALAQSPSFDALPLASNDVWHGSNLDLEYQVQTQDTSGATTNTYSVTLTFHLKKQDGKWYLIAHS